MALYTIRSQREMANMLNAPKYNPNSQTMWNTLGRNAGEQQATGSSDNFFTKKWNSLENAVGTTLAAPASFFYDNSENIKTDQLRQDNKNRMNDIAKKYGYNTWSDWQDAFYNAQDAGDTVKVSAMQEQLKEFQNQANANAEATKNKADAYKDYRENNYVSQKINQDRGKFLGSAINTESTLFDALSMAAGIPNGALVNAGQGAIEGLADELEQNGFQNFDLGRAGQNAAVGAASGAVTGVLNKGLSNSLAKRGGQLLKGGNAITRGINNFNQTAAGKVLSTVGMGAGRGAITGAVGGATGAGIASALQGGDLGTNLANAAQGAVKGAQGGALTGGIMAGANMAVDATLNKVAPNIANSVRENQMRNASYGDKLREQFKGALDSGDSVVAEKVLKPLANKVANVTDSTNMKQGFVATPFANEEQANANNQPLPETPTEEEKPFAAYGESDLATGKTKKQNIISKAGRAMQAAQANATRKETRDIGIENAGELINKVRRRSGLTDLEKQSAFAKELTGGENSLLDSVQRNAISATEDGRTRTVNLDAVSSKVNKLIDDLPNTMVSPTQKENIRSAVIADLTNGGIDTITKANNFKAAAAQQFLINEKTPNDSAKALGVFYTKVGDLVDDASYSEIPRTQVEAMFETAASEARSRAKVAGNNGKTDIQDAYTRLATELDESPKTMQAYRSLKKDYVDVNKLNKKTQQGATAWNNSPLVMGTALTTAMATGNPLVAVPAAWAAKTLAPAVGQAAIDASASLGGKIADWGDAISARRSGTPAVVPTTATNFTSYNPSTQIYNAIGRNEGLNNGEQMRTANYLADAVQNENAVTNTNATTLEGLVSPTSTNSTTAYNSVYGGTTPAQVSQSGYFQLTGDYWTDILGKAMSAAIDADDVEAFGALYGMYQDALSNLQKSSSSETKLSDKQRQANAAALALDAFELTEPNAAYDVSDIPVIGAIANLGGNEYASKAEALALQIGYMLSGATVNREEAKNIGMAYVPQPRDNAAVRQSKLNQIRGIISEYQKTYAD